MNSILDRQIRAPYFFNNTILVLITCQFGYDFEEKDFKVLFFQNTFSYYLVMEAFNNFLMVTFAFPSYLHFILTTVSHSNSHCVECQILR